MKNKLRDMIKLNSVAKNLFGFLFVFLAGEFAFAQACTLGTLITNSAPSEAGCNSAISPFTSTRPSCSPTWGNGTTLDRGTNLGGAAGCMVDSNCSDLNYSYRDCNGTDPSPAGVQNRFVECRDSDGLPVGDQFCDPATRPLATQTCGGCTVTAGTTWSASGNTCAADADISIPEGGSTTVSDSTGTETGQATWSCATGGVLSGPTAASCTSSGTPMCGPTPLFAGEDCCQYATGFVVEFTKFNITTQCCSSSSAPGVSAISSAQCSPPLCTSKPYGATDPRVLTGTYTTAPGCDAARVALPGSGHTCYTCRSGAPTVVRHQLWRQP